MSKPPKTPPNSDIDGVREDQHDIIDSANRAGQDAGDLDKAKRKSIGRPAGTGGKARNDRSG